MQQRGVTGCTTIKLIVSASLFQTLEYNKQHGVIRFVTTDGRQHQKVSNMTASEKVSEICISTSDSSRIKYTLSVLVPKFIGESN